MNLIDYPATARTTATKLWESLITLFTILMMGATFGLFLRG